MATRPLRPIESLSLTYTARTAATASSLYSGSLQQLSGSGFIVEKTGISITEKTASCSYVITIPVASGSVNPGVDTDAMEIFVNEISGSVIPTIKQEWTDAGATDDVATQQTVPDTHASYAS